MQIGTEHKRKSTIPDGALGGRKLYQNETIVLVVPLMVLVPVGAGLVAVVMVVVKDTGKRQVFTGIPLTGINLWFSCLSEVFHFHVEIVT